MWGENNKNCDNCECSGLITDKFRINSGNNATKRKQEDSVTINYKTKMNPQALDFSASPNSPIYTAGKRRILGQIQLTESPLQRLKSPVMIPAKLKLSPLVQTSSIKSPLQITNSPFLNKSSPLATHSPLTTRNKRSRISKVLEERTRFKSSNKENEPAILSETFVKLDHDEAARDYLFGKQFSSSWRSTKKLSTTKLDFSNAVSSSNQGSFFPTMPSPKRDSFIKTIPSPKQDSFINTILSPKQDSLVHSFPSPKQDSFVPEKEITQDFEDLEDLHDLEEEFEMNFDECTKYEIISTDSPNIISRGRTTSTRKVTSRNFVFGAPLGENEASTSFNKPNITVTRMLTFEEDDFDFTSPAVKKAAKKSLDFSEESTVKIEKSDSGIGSMMSLSQSSPNSNFYKSETMESGFASELSQLSQPFLENENSQSPKVENLIDLISGQIKCSEPEQTFVRRPLNRSISLNPDSRARTSLFSILENPERRTYKRMERAEMEVSNKRRKSNCLSPVVRKADKVQRPVLLRAFSENNAAIMSAMDRSVMNEDLIADFSVPFALPLINGDHLDLKSISCDTLAGLLKGDFDDTISDYQVIDCRYPYEYEGGHIMNAVNYFTPDQIQELINKPIHHNMETGKRSILVFHCEFSIERGPKLFRYLRSSDRRENKDRYPQLHYPEVYLLHSGYKNFYENYPELCSPSGYIAMMDPSHKSSLRVHRK